MMSNRLTGDKRDIQFFTFTVYKAKRDRINLNRTSNLGVSLVIKV